MVMNTAGSLQPLILLMTSESFWSQLAVLLVHIIGLLWLPNYVVSLMLQFLLSIWALFHLVQCWPE